MVHRSAVVPSGLDSESNNMFLLVFVLVGEAALTEAVPGDEVRLFTSAQTISGSAPSL